MNWDLPGKFAPEILAGAVLAIMGPLGWDLFVHHNEAYGMVYWMVAGMFVFAAGIMRLAAQGYDKTNADLIRYDQ